MGGKRIFVAAATALATLLIFCAYIVARFSPAHLPYRDTMTYQVVFTWDEGVKRITVVNPETGRAEREGVLTRMIASEAEKTLPSMVEQLGLRKVQGTLYCGLAGTKQLYRVVCNDSAGAMKDIQDPDSRKPLLVAAGDGDTAAIEKLIQSGADVNTTDQQGETALMRAALKGNIAALRVLVVSGTALNSRDYQGRTALLYAVDSGNASAAAILVSAGADVNVADSKGWTVLMDAAAGHESEIVRVLLAAGANVNATNQDGETALMNAVLFGTPTVLKALLAAHPDLEIRSKDGKTALDLAKSIRRSGVEALLGRAGAAQ